jgi:hypothetical protein
VYCTVEYTELQCRISCEFLFSLQQEKALSAIAISLEVYVNFCNFKALLLFHNDAHNHKITGILKNLKFRQSLRHVPVHVGTIVREPFLCLA